MPSGSRGNEFATDTMALVLRLEERKLGRKAKAAFEKMEARSATIHVPTIVIAELMYLSEKKRIQATLADLDDYMARCPRCSEAPLTLAVIRKAALLVEITELHDRLIAATASDLNVPLITNDPEIGRIKQLPTVW